MRGSENIGGISPLSEAHQIDRRSWQRRDMSVRPVASIGHYAEVHHLRPLSLGPQTLLTIADFAVLCANCHRAIHRPDIYSATKFLSDLKSKISTH